MSGSSPRPGLFSTSPFLAFAGFGVFWGVWGACLPLLRAHAGVGDARFGVALLLVGAGALPAMLLTGRLVDAVGLRVAGMLLALLGVSGVVLCAISTGYAGLCAGILAVGAASGASDVAINTLAATVEKRTARPVVARSHAAFSAAVAASSLAAGALAAATGSLLAAFTAAAALVAAVAVTVVTATRPAAVRTGAGAPRTDIDVPQAAGPDGRRADARRAWDAAGRPSAEPEGRSDQARAGVRAVTGTSARPRRRGGAGRLPGGGALVVIGGIGALAFAAENAFQTWGAVLLADAFSASPAVAAVAPAAFAATAALARLAGGPVMLRRPIAALVTSGLIATAGGVLTAVAPSLPIALAGVVAAALGTATLFPTLLSYGLRPVPDAFRGRATSAVSTVAYLGFLAGPAYFGMLADAGGVQRAFLGVAALTGVLLATLPVLPRLSRPATDHERASRGGDGAPERVPC
ncbi:MFS transporter [Nonomuraea fastidiosa]|uniref:MFS transporter n=1 Tax=Nonomuraea fastidiosa TaxID=46173 RepID=UPI003670225B